MPSPRIAPLALLLAAGCMKIYPDSELPDLHVQWSSSDCRPEAPNVQLTLTLDGAVVEDRMLACADLETTFVDVTPARYRLDSRLLFTDGEVFSAWSSELDMRDAFDADEYVYFGGFGNLRVAWVFADGATCESLDANIVLVDVEGQAGAGDPYNLATCQLPPWVGYVYGEQVSIRVRAVHYVDYDQYETRAISELLGPITTTSSGELTNLGTVTLTPCDPCP